MSTPSVCGVPFIKNNPTFADLSSRLPFWHFDDNIMVYADGSLGAGLRLTGIDISAASIDRINELSQALENLINTAQEGVRFQIYYRLTSDVAPLIKEHQNITATIEGDSYDAVARSRIEYLTKNAQAGSYFQPQIYFFVRSDRHGYQKQRFWESDRKFQDLTQKEYLDHKTKFLRNLVQIESSLAHAGIEPRLLSKDEWFSLLYESLNLFRSEKLPSPKFRDLGESNSIGETLCAQCTLTDVEVHKSHLQIGDYLFRVITLKTLPEGQSYASMVEAFLKLPFHFWASQTLTVHEQKREVEKLQIQRRLAHSMASGAGHVSDLESESKLSHIEGLIGELLEGSEKIVSTDLNIIVWAREIETLEEKSDEVLKAFRNLGQSEGVIETLPCFDAFIRTIPGTCTGFRTKKVKTSNAAHLMPVYSSWQGNKRPVCLLSLIHI